MTALRFFFLSVASLALCSCGESFSKVAERNQSDIDAFKADLAVIATVLPEKPGEIVPARPLDPAPKFVKDDLAASNTLITALPQLTDPNAEVAKDKGLDFYLNDAKNLLIWAGWDDQKAGDDYEEKLRAAFGLRYVVVFRNLMFKAPSIIDDKTYGRGGVILAVDVYDRETGAIVCSFPVAAQAAEKVDFQYEAGGSGNAEALSEARSTLWSNAREAMLKALREKTGGTFEAK